MLSNLLLPAKAYSPIYSTDSGILISLRLSQYDSADDPISLTDAGMSMLLSPLKANAPIPIDFNDAGRVMLSNFSHSWKASLPIETTVFGITASLRLRQVKNASSLIAVSVFGHVTLEMLV